jgi:hypothetical protein
MTSGMPTEWKEDIIGNAYTASIKRLLLKTAAYIGKPCRDYFSFLIEQTHDISSIELEILERILSMGLYADEVIDCACFTALEQRISSIIEFNFALCEVNNKMTEAGD